MVIVPPQRTLRRRIGWRGRWAPASRFERPAKLLLSRTSSSSSSSALLLIDRETALTLDLQPAALEGIPAPDVPGTLHRRVVQGGGPRQGDPRCPQVRLDCCVHRALPRLRPQVHCLTDEHPQPSLVTRFPRMFSLRHTGSRTTLRRKGELHASSHSWRALCRTLTGALSFTRTATACRPVTVRRLYEN